MAASVPGKHRRASRWLVGTGVALLLCAGGLALVALPGVGQWTPPAWWQSLWERQALNLRLVDLEGRVVELASYRGQVVLLSFWMTTCKVCREELPYLQELHQDRGSRGLMVLAVNLDGSARYVRDFVTERGYTFPVLLDDRAHTATRLYKVGSLPRTILIDRRGIIRYDKVGFSERSFARMEGTLVELLKENEP